VVHYLPPPVAVAGGVTAQAGFVVSRAVGGSVERHRVVRRLRHLVRDRLDRLPAGARLVIRALPPAGEADSGALGQDLDLALARVLDSARPESGRSARPESGRPESGRGAAEAAPPRRVGRRRGRSTAPADDSTGPDSVAAGSAGPVEAER
jgi:ribonuclease P protein component